MQMGLLPFLLSAFFIMIVVSIAGAIIRDFWVFHVSDWIKYSPKTFYTSLFGAVTFIVIFWGAYKSQ